jgi:5-dehydro-2-deoxygluconokinase
MAIAESVDCSGHLFVMPFDHRSSFQEKLFGIQGRLPSAEEVLEITRYKSLVYEGFQRAIAMGAPKQHAALLVDEQFGKSILLDAKQKGFQIACPVEKSGQEEFDFEYGSDFSQHIEEIQPDFVKVLVRYNPHGDPGSNQRQMQRLKLLSEYCHLHHRKFMLELLVPPTSEQAQRLGSEYDTRLRPELMVQSIEQFQAAGVEPDVWKLEGMESSSHCKLVAKQARLGGRDEVGLIILGRGENVQHVRHWLSVASTVPGFIGFAVGRTVFWESLKGYKEGRYTAQVAIDQIANHYKFLCDLWMQSQAQ